MSALAEQHERWAGARSRLWGSSPPPQKPVPPRPVSPFSVLRTPTHRALPDLPRIPIAPWRAIVAEVAVKHGVTDAAIIGPTRQRKIVAARHEAVFRIYTETMLSSTEIARRLGGRDHTTAIHSIQWYCKQVPWAPSVLAAAKERRVSQERTAVAHAQRKARELLAEGKTMKQILGLVPLSESGLHKALKEPLKLSTGQSTEPCSSAVASLNPREHMEDRCSTEEAV